MNENIVNVLQSNPALLKFVGSENTELLWGLLNNQQNNKWRQAYQNEAGLRSYFILQIKEFVEKKAFSKQSLINLNRDFISSFVLNITKEQEREQEEQPKKLVIHPTSSTSGIETISVEELKSEKNGKEMANKYEEMQGDFQNYMKQDIPQEIDFSKGDGKEDAMKVEEMQRMVNTKMEQRNNVAKEAFPEKTTTMDQVQIRRWLNLEEKDGKDNTQNSTAIDTSTPMKMEKSVKFMDVRPFPDVDMFANETNNIVPNPPVYISTPSPLSEVKRMSDTNTMDIENRLSRIEDSVGEILDFIKTFQKPILPSQPPPSPVKSENGEEKIISVTEEVAIQLQIEEKEEEEDSASLVENLQNSDNTDTESKLNIDPLSEAE